MRNAKCLAFLFVLVFAVPLHARAGLNVYPVGGPAPAVHVEPPKPVEYQIQKGDTVAVIAKKFSVDAKALMAANGMTDPRKLQAGKKLKIPGTAAPAKPATAASPAGAAATAAATPGTPAQAATSQPTPKPLAAATPPSATASPATASTSAPIVVPPAPPVKEIVPDAKGRKAGKEAVDPGAAEEHPVKGKKGKKGKAEPVVQAPTIEVDAKTRASFGKTGVITNATDVPQPIRDEFFRYAIKWLDDLETLGVGTFANKKIHQVGGQWEATYRIVIRESLGAEVKKVNYEAEDTPYVGHITYVQRVFTSVGPTKQAALAGPYTSKDEAIREIFSYSGKKKAWR